jgi:hypothetical protein
MPKQKYPCSATCGPLKDIRLSHLSLISQVRRFCSVLQVHNFALALDDSERNKGKRLTLGLTQSPIQWVPKALLKQQSSRRVKHSTCLHPAPRFTIPPLPSTPSWHSEAQGGPSLLAFMLTWCLFQTRNDTVRAFNEISDLVSKLVIPVKQVK